MVGMKRREIFSSPSFVQKLQFDHVTDLYIHSEPSTSASLSNSSHRTKCVHFLMKPQVFIVPNRYEYYEAGINLWWTQNDIKHFRRDYFLSSPSASSSSSLSTTTTVTG